MKRVVLFISALLTAQVCGAANFSTCTSLLIPRSIQKIKQHPELTIQKTKIEPYLVWQRGAHLTNNVTPFSELILSWNASLPPKGHYSFWVEVEYPQYDRKLKRERRVRSGWKKLATWGLTERKTFSNTKNRFVHTKHVRVEMQRKKLGCGYRVKVMAHDGADLRRVKALFVNTANWNLFREQRPPRTLASTYIPNVPKQSQWWIKHPRACGLCAPTSISIVNAYFAKDDCKKFSHNAKFFADQAYDQSLKIYGNWIFDTAGAFDAIKGRVLYRVQRLNNFVALYKYLKNNIPIAVSIRGNLRGSSRIKNSKSFKSHENGHFVVVVGWNQKTETVTCVDPAFPQKNLIERHYKIGEFIKAWGKSRNLSYVPIPKKSLLG